MRRLLQLLLFYLMLLWLGAMLLLGNAACVPLVLAPRRWREPLLQRLISAVFRIFLAGCEACGLMRLDLRALDALDGERGGLLLVANHPSMIDVFLVVSRLRRVLCLMKASVAANAFLAVGARLAGYIANRNGVQLLREATRAARAGRHLLIFPEGTRTAHAPLGPLKPGVGLIAKRAGVPLQLVLLRNNSAYLAKGWPIWRPPRFPLHYQARLGPRLQASASVDETMRRLHAALERELAACADPSDA